MKKTEINMEATYFLAGKRRHQKNGCVMKSFF